MRLLLAAVVVLALAARPSLARSPQNHAPYALATLIAELKQRGADAKEPLAIARFYADVFHATEVSAPRTDAAQAARAALLPAENLVLSKQCAPLTGAELAAAAKVVEEFGAALPVTLRAYTLGSQGKKDEAATLLAQRAEPLAKQACEGLAADAVSAQAQQLRFALECLKQFDPARDVKALQAGFDKAKGCASRGRKEG